MDSKQEIMSAVEPEIAGARKVILHYHLFKNAGTSLDAAFKDALEPNQWITKEFTTVKEANLAELKQWIQNNPNAVCFSSHTASLPAPELESVSILPIIFLRHPIDRIASAYTFESSQNTDTLGSRLARNSSLAEYIEARLSIKNDHQCRNFHAYRLSAFSNSDDMDLSSKAQYAFENLPFIGLVEAYEKSLHVLNDIFISRGLENVQLKSSHKNASRDKGRSLESKLEDIRREIGIELYKKLECVNSVDLFLFGQTAKRYGYIFEGSTSDILI